MDYETLLYEQDEHVVTLTYNRPEQHNAINRRMNEELQHAWQRFRDDDSAFVLVITGAGETTFSAGWDLADAAALEEAPDWESWRREVWNSPGACGYTRRVDVFKPVIAAVNGYAFAAGLETALLADIRIAAENAEFGALERRWNIVAGDGMTAPQRRQRWSRIGVPAGGWSGGGRFCPGVRGTTFRCLLRVFLSESDLGVRVGRSEGYVAGAIPS